MLLDTITFVDEHVNIKGGPFGHIGPQCQISDKNPAQWAEDRLKIGNLMHGRSLGIELNLRPCATGRTPQRQTKKLGRQARSCRCIF